MTLLFKYAFKKFFVVSLVLTVMIIFILWLAQSLRYMDLIVNNAVSLNAYFSLVAFLLPDLFVVISPIAFAIATLFCFHKLQISHELAALRSLGVSSFRLAMPVLAIASGLLALLIFLNMIIVPASFQKLKQQEYMIRSAFSGAFLKEGSFNTTKGFTLYVREHNDEDELFDLFIYQPAKNNKPAFTTLAEFGRVFKNGNRLLLLLKKGQRHEYDPNTREFSFFSFDEFVYDLTDILTPSPSSRPERPSEKSIKQLLNPDDSIKEDMRRKFRSEAHQRILLPFLCLLDSLLISAILLSGELGRRHSRRKFVIAVGLIFCVHVFTMGFLYGSVRYTALLYVAYLFVFLGMIASLWFLAKDLWFTRKSRRKNISKGYVQRSFESFSLKTHETKTHETKVPS